MWIVLQATGYTNKTVNLSEYLNINITPTAWTITNSSPVCTGAGSVSINLDGSDMGISYQAYKGATAIGSAVSGDATGNQNPPSALGPFTTIGTYTVIATDGTTGCTNQMNNSVVINQTPATPTFSYVWCSGGSLNLHSLSTEPNLVAYYWRNGSTMPNGNQTATTQDATFTPLVSNGNNIYLTVANAYCSSLESAGTAVYQTTVNTPTPTYTWCTGGYPSLNVGTPTTGATYLWTNTTHPSTQSSSTAITSYTQAGTATNDGFSVSASYNGCTSSTVSLGSAHSSPTPTPSIVYLGYDNAVSGTTAISNPTGTYNLVGASYLHWDMVCSVDATVTYQWYRGATAIGTNNYDMGTLTQVSSKSGAYTVKQTNSCASVTSAAVTMNFSASGRIGIEETESNNSLLYPNPTNGELNINSPYDNYTLSITNLLGSEVLSKQVNQTSTQVDLSSLSAGSYVVKIIGIDGAVTKKIQLVK